MHSQTDTLISKISCKDHSVSGEEFDLLYDPQFDMLITHPQPSPEKLPSYYESDNYISHTDGKRGVFEKLYQLVKNYSLNKKVKLITKLNSGAGSLLDIGTGTGDFLVAASKLNWQAFGTEPNEKARNIALQKKQNVVADISLIQQKDFDVITLWHVLEHVPNVKQYLDSITKLLSTNGILIIAVPNFKSYDAEYYDRHWAAYDVPRHLWHFSKSTIKQLAQENYLDVTKILPMKFDSYYVSLLSEKYKSGKMNWIKAFRIGFRSNRKANRNGEFSSLIYALKKTNIA